MNIPFAKGENWCCGVEDDSSSKAPLPFRSGRDMLVFFFSKKDNNTVQDCYLIISLCFSVCASIKKDTFLILSQRSEDLSGSLSLSGRAHSLTCCGRPTFNFHYMLLLSGFSWFCQKQMMIIFHWCLLILNFFFPSWWYSTLCLT